MLKVDISSEFNVVYVGPERFSLESTIYYEMTEDELYEWYANMKTGYLILNECEEDF